MNYVTLRTKALVFDISRISVKWYVIPCECYFMKNALVKASSTETKESLHLPDVGDRALY